MEVLVGVSARHIHLTKDVYDKLFDEPLEKLRDLDQPGQFAARQTVGIKNGDKIIGNVRIVGPLRHYNQVEVARSDAYKLGLNPPVRSSGDVDGSLPITLFSAKGEVNLPFGVIIANRHIHITPADIRCFGLEDAEKVVVKVLGEKAGVFKNVYLKVSDSSSLRLHLDIDDANAFNLKNGDKVEVFKEGD